MCESTTFSRQFLHVKLKDGNIVLPDCFSLHLGGQKTPLSTGFECTLYNFFQNFHVYLVTLRLWSLVKWFSSLNTKCFRECARKKFAPVPSGLWDPFCVPPTLVSPALTPFLTHPHPPYCGSAHTWPSQIRAREKPASEEKSGMHGGARGREGRGRGRLVDGVFQHSDGAKS